MKCYGYHLLDVDKNIFNYKYIISIIFNQINKLGIKYRKGYYYDKLTKKKYDIYWGWAHFSVTKELAKYLVDFYDNNPNFNKYFKTIFPPDETYFQTIIYNSIYRNKLDDLDDSCTQNDMLNLTYFEYPKYVRIFHNSNELLNINLDSYLFIRKVDLDFINSMNIKK